MALLLGVLPLGPAQRAGAQGEAKPRFEISPKTWLVGEKGLDIRLVDLKPNQAVTVIAQLGQFVSRTEAKADQQGCVGLNGPMETGPKTGGPYRILWSMKQDAAAQPTKPPDVVQLRAEVDEKVVATGALQLNFGTDNDTKVERVEVKEDGLRGVFFLPRGQGRFPGVLMVSGSTGGLRGDLERSAALLAHRGFATLALAYFSYEGLPERLEEIPLEYFETALKWMQRHKQVREDRLAVVGTSRGGELALLLGSKFPQLRAVVAYVPSHVPWGSFPWKEDDLKQGIARPAWTYRKEPIPFVDLSADKNYAKKLLQKDATLYGKWVLDYLRENEQAVQKAAIPVENTNGPVLLITGTDDKMWPSTYMAEEVMKRLAPRKGKYADRHLKYDGCGHSFGLPGMPVRVGRFKHRQNGAEVDRGGNPEGSAWAAWDSWIEVNSFLSTSLK
jgi:dienelactone hydrolase